MLKIIYGVQLDLNDDEENHFGKHMGEVDDSILDFAIALPLGGTEYECFIYLRDLDDLITEHLKKSSLSTADLKNLLVQSMDMDKDLGDFNNHSIINAEMKEELERLAGIFVENGAPESLAGGIHTIGEYSWHLINVAD
jgi:hypothetical protein